MAEFGYCKDVPAGEDLYEGQPQERLADSIFKFIKSEDSSDAKIIGLEGGWGTGKSNVIKIIEKKIKDSFDVFTFNVWGHQGDDLLYIFAEELNEYLFARISNKKKKEKLASKFNKLSQNHIHKDTRSTASISIIGLIIIAIFWGGNALNSIYGNFPEDTKEKIWPMIMNWGPLIGLLLAVVIVCCIVSWKKKYKGQAIKYSLCDILLEYQGNKKETYTEEVIRQKKITSKEFRSYIEYIDKEIYGDSLNMRKKIILVFDNFDRLPDEEIRELWGMIHVYFSGDSEQFTYKNIKVILPFDRKHIENAFANGNNDGDNFATDYINKTFDFCFHVAPPILSNWRKYFITKWKESNNGEPCEEIDKELEVSMQIIDACFTYEEINPRLLLQIINEVQSIIYCNSVEIPYRYIVFYIVSKMKRKGDIVNLLLYYNDEEKSFYNRVRSLLEDDDYLKYMTMLIYQLQNDDSSTVVLERKLKESILNNNHDEFFAITNSYVFSQIANKVVRSLRFDQLNNAVRFYNELEKSDKKTLEKGQWDAIWETLAKLYLNGNSDKPISPTYELDLMHNLNDEKTKQNIAAKIARLNPLPTSSDLNEYCLIVDRFKEEKVKEDIVNNLITLNDFDIATFYNLVNLKEYNYKAYYRGNITSADIEKYLQGIAKNTYGPKLYKFLRIIKNDFNLGNYISACVVETENQNAANVLIPNLLALNALNKLSELHPNTINMTQDLYNIIESQSPEAAYIAIAIVLIKLISAPNNQASQAPFVQTVNRCKSDIDSAKYYLTISKGKNIDKLINYAYVHKEEKACNILRAVLNFGKDELGVIKELNINILINNYDKLVDIADKKTVLTFFDNCSWKAGEEDLNFDIKKIINKNFFGHCYQSQDIAFCKKVYEKVNAFIKNLSTDDFSAMIGDPNGIWIDVIKEINFSGFTQAHLDGLEKYVRDNNGKIEGDNAFAHVSYLLQEMQDKEDLPKSSFFLALYSLYSNNPIRHQEFNVFGEGLLDYGAFAENQELAISNIFNSDVMNDATCIEIIINHEDKVIDILKKCLNETQKTFFNRFKGQNEEIANRIKKAVGFEESENNE